MPPAKNRLFRPAKVHEAMFLRVPGRFKTEMLYFTRSGLAMDMYLRHYFDPNFDYQSLRPTPAGQGDTDCYNLGYVQNVVKGQILAELVPLAEVEEPLPGSS